MRTVNIGRFALAALAAALFAVPSLAGEVVLVENGVSRAPIVVFEDAPRLTRLAADDLAVYIEKISGARPEVIEGRPDPIPESAVWVGYQPALDELFPGLDFDFQHPEEILVAANERHLVAAGRDVWDPGNMVRHISRGRTIEGVQREYGTVNAVYTLLQDFLDVRWLWPGEIGEDIAEKDTIAFAPFEYRYHPQIRGRSGLFSRSSLSRHGFRTAYEPQNWSRFQRLLLDSLEVPGGHAYGDWWDRFHETHPEYFALQPDGTRSGFPRPSNAKVCHSNPAVWQRWIADVEEQIARDPSRIAFNASPNDSFTSGHCVCAHCLAWDHPDGEMLRFIWEGTSQEYVALSDRTITYANKVARMLEERYPGEGLHVFMLAYGNWRPVPVEAVPDDNVIIGSVTNFHNRPAASRRVADSRELFRAWAEVAPHIVWRPNLGFGIWQVGLPRTSARRAIDDMRMVAEHNVIGLYFDTLWGHWATHGVQYYMLGRMAWNPYADGDAILDDYYRRGFGKAAEHVRAYWELIEETNEAIVFDDEVSWPDAFNAAFFEEAQGHLDRAAAAVADEPGKHSDRVEFVRIGLDFTRHYMEAREHMLRFRASEGQDEQAQEAARKIWLEDIRPLLMNDKHPHALSEAFAGPRAGRALRELYPEGLLDEWY